MKGWRRAALPWKPRLLRGYRRDRLPMVPGGLSFGLAHVLHGKSHRSCFAKVPMAASRSLDLFDTGAEPEETLCSPKGRAGGCPGAALGIPGDFPGSPGAGIRAGSAARQRERALQRPRLQQPCQFGIRQRSCPAAFHVCLTLLFTQEQILNCKTGSAPRFFFFPFFL